MANPEFLAASAVVTVPSNGNGSVSLDKPAGLADGDYIFVAIFSSPSSSLANAAPSGFGSPILNADNWAFGCGMRVYGKVASSEPASYTLTETSSNAQGFAVSWAYTNPNGTPIDAAFVDPTYPTTSTPTFPTLTATVAGKYIGFAVNFGNSNRTITPSGALVSRVQRTTAVSFLICDEEVSAGSISGRSSSSASGDFFTAGIILSGASGGGGGSIVGPGLTSSPLLAGRLLRGLAR